MINNIGIAAITAIALTASGCRDEPRHPGALQGVVELDERDLAFEVGGRLRTVDAAEGDQVSAGQLLASLDDALERTARESREHEAGAARAQTALVRSGARPSDLESLAAQIDAARAGEDLARTNLDREQRLFAHGATTQAAVDQLAARHRSAAAERKALEQRLRSLRSGARDEEVTTAEERAGAATSTAALASQRLDLYQLHAPAAGRVVTVVRRTGEVVGPGTPVLTVADARRPYADVFVPEGRLGGVRVGQAARIEVDAESTPLAGAVEHIASRAEFTPRFLFSESERPNLVIRVRVRIDDPDERLHAGVPAFITLEGAR